MPDAAIDYSDIPRLTRGMQWTRPEALVPTGNKQKVTLRLDVYMIAALVEGNSLPAGDFAQFHHSLITEAN